MPGPDLTCERCDETAPAGTPGWRPWPPMCPECLDSIASKNL
jgi:hypothetical protein